MWSRHPVLLGWWLFLLGSFGLGLLIESELLLFMPIFIAIVLAAFTLRLITPGTLARPKLYYALVGTLLLSSSAVVVAAGSTLIVRDSASFSVAGFFALGAANLLIAIVTWRALTKPTPKRAAGAGALALFLELIAMVIDVIMNYRVPDLDGHEKWIMIVLLGAVISLGTGALACVGAIVAFVPPDEHDIPAARIVDESAQS